MANLPAASALGLIEVRGWTPAMIVLDAIDKAATIRLLHAELNDLGGICMKVAGSSADLRSAMARAETTARQMHADCVTDLIDRPEPAGRGAYEAAPEYSPLLEGNLVFHPADIDKETAVTDEAPFAIGLIETQGFTAVIEAIDTACKAANVEVIGKEKLGGGYVTVVIKGDVAAVNAAVDSGKSKVEGLGNLIAAHVIPRPSQGVLALMTRVDTVKS